MTCPPLALVFTAWMAGGWGPAGSVVRDARSRHSAVLAGPGPVCRGPVPWEPTEPGPGTGGPWVGWHSWRPRYPFEFGGVERGWAGGPSPVSEPLLWERTHPGRSLESLALWGSLFPNFIEVCVRVCVSGDRGRHRRLLWPSSGTEPASLPVSDHRDYIE